MWIPGRSTDKFNIHVIPSLLLPPSRVPRNICILRYDSSGANRARHMCDILEAMLIHCDDLHVLVYIQYGVDSDIRSSARVHNKSHGQASLLGSARSRKTSFLGKGGGSRSIVGHPSKRLLETLGRLVSVHRFSPSGTLCVHLYSWSLSHGFYPVFWSMGI